MPMIRNLVTRHLKKFPEYSIDPDHAVALGAAIQSALVAQDKALEDVIMTDVAPFSVGIESAMKDASGNFISGFFSPLIERNTPLPASREGIFSTTTDNQRELRIAVYQGEAAMVEENIHIGEFVLSIPAAPAGKEGMVVRITYDSSGLIEVEAHSNSLNHKEALVIETNATGLNKSEIKKRLEAMQAFKTHPAEDEHNIALLARLERLYSMAHGSDRIYIQSLILRFKSALQAQDVKKIETERGEILDIINRIDDFYVS